MSKATLEYDLPDDESAFLAAIHGYAVADVLWTLLNRYLKGKLDDPSALKDGYKELDALQEFLCDELQYQCVNLDHIIL